MIGSQADRRKLTASAYRETSRRTATATAQGQSVVASMPQLQDEQEPRQRRQPRRHRPRLRRRHVPPVRDVHGPAGSAEAVEHARHRRHVAVPEQRLAQSRRRRGSKTRRKRREGAIERSPIPEALDRQMHRTIKKVGEDIEGLRFNTAIAELIKLNNEITGMPSRAARAGGEFRADARAVRAAHRRGNLGAAGAHQDRSRIGPGRRSTRPSWSKRRWNCPCRSTASCATRSPSPPMPTRRRSCKLAEECAKSCNLDRRKIDQEAAVRAEETGEHRRRLVADERRWTQIENLNAKKYRKLSFRNVLMRNLDSQRVEILREYAQDDGAGTRSSAFIGG